MIPPRKYLEGRSTTGPLWPGKWNELAAEMLRGDLEAAGIVYRDASGCVADFHALRHSYISLLGSMGNSPKVTQTLARHSDIRLTMNIYSHAQLHDLANAVEGLPVGLPKDSDSASMKATGTDGRLQCACSENEEPRGIVRKREDNTPIVAVHDNRPQTLMLIDSEEASGDERNREENLPRMDSNHHKESQNVIVHRGLTREKPSQDNFQTSKLAISLPPENPAPSDPTSAMVLHALFKPPSQADMLAAIAAAHGFIE